MQPEIDFYIGKGGVGKSTISALDAVHFSENSCDTLLVSMDPAHNQRDIFNTRFSEKPKMVVKNLAVKEVDTDYWVGKYLKDTQNSLKRAYGYQSAFNLENYFNVLRLSPGVEEYALLLAFEDVVRNHQDKDVIVFDMAPTAFTLKFLSLPFSTIVWLEELTRLRCRINQKKEIVTRIKFGKKEFEKDKVKQKLAQLTRTHEHLSSYFVSDRTKFNLVMNNDRLSFSEAVRIQNKLALIGIRIASIIVNKCPPHENIDAIKTEFPHQPVRFYPLSLKSLSQLDALYDYVHRNKDSFRPSRTGSPGSVLSQE